MVIYLNISLQPVIDDYFVIIMLCFFGSTVSPHDTSCPTGYAVGAMFLLHQIGRSLHRFSFLPLYTGRFLVDKHWACYVSPENSVSRSFRGEGFSFEKENLHLANFYLGNIDYVPLLLRHINAEHDGQL
jgi:hypothetical protein